MKLGWLVVLELGVGIQLGHGTRLSVGLEAVLANHEESG